MRHWPPVFTGDFVAKPNYSFEKRQRELAKKKKKEEKEAKKRAGRDSAATGEPGDDAGSADPHR